jgi:cysteine desulfuration protein SufE
MSATLDEILSNFELLDDWEERYRYLIELGRMMPPLPDEAHNGSEQGDGMREPGVARESGGAAER